MAWAIKILWRDGGEEYLRDRTAPRAPVETFPTREAARQRRRDLLDAAAWEVSALDIVPAPRERPERHP